MEIRQLLYFIAIYEEGSVTNASRRLNIVQPAVSQQLAKLEDSLGGALFQRTPKGVHPTFLGDEAYRLFLPIVQKIEIARHELSSDRKHVGGNLAIGAIGSIAHELLPEALIVLGQQYPDVTFRVTGGYSAELVEMLRNGKIDLAIINGGQRNNDRVEERLFSENLALICHADHPSAKSQGPVVQEDLNRLVLPTVRHGLRDVIERAALEMGLELYPHLECDEIATLKQFVSHGGYVTILPPIALRRAFMAGELVARKMTSKIARKVVYAYSPARPLSRAAELCIAELRAQLATIPNALITLSQDVSAKNDLTSSSAIWDRLPEQE